MSCFEGRPRGSPRAVGERPIVPKAAATIAAVEPMSSGRCVVYREPTGPTGVRIETRPRQPTAEGAVTVAIEAASLNHLDVWLVSGAQRIEPPRVPCADGAGVVAESQSPRWRQGDEVVIYPVTC